MAKEYLEMIITFNIKEASFNIEGNVREEHQGDLITEFLRTQLGKGIDNSKANIKDSYHIYIKWFPDGDIFKIQSDTINKGVRDGILMKIVSLLN